MGEIEKFMTIVLARGDNASGSGARQCACNSSGSGKSNLAAITPIYTELMSSLRQTSHLQERSVFVLDSVDDALQSKPVKISHFVAALFCLMPSVTADELLTLDNGVVKMGIDRSKGAAITSLSWPAHPKNVVNFSDPGRLIQQSYYAGKGLDRRADGQNEHWSPWTWNPIQGGGISSWARVTKFEVLEAPQTLFSETVPKLWDMPDEEADAVMRQWTQHEPGMPDVIVVRCEFVSKRKPDDRWGPAIARHQELPACYFTRKFDRFKSYLSSGKWRPETQAPGPPWGRADPPKNAMACFAAEGQGVAVFSPAATEAWNFGPNGEGSSDDPNARPCVHIAPIATIRLSPRSTMRYRYWLVVGSEAQIAQRLDQLVQKYSSEQIEILEP